MSDQIIVTPEDSRKKLPKIKLAGRNLYAGTSQPLVGSEFFESDQIGRFPTEIRNPTLNPEMFYLPRFSSADGTANVELNNWYDHYYRFDPLIGNLIDLHSTLPVSRFGLVGITDPVILREFEEVAEDLDLLSVIMQMFKQYFLKGEFFMYASWSEDQKTFTGINLLDTNLLTVLSHNLLIGKHKGDVPERYLLETDPFLSEIVQSTDDFYKELVDEYLDDDIKQAVEQGYRLLIDPFSGTFVKRSASPWDLRGVSILNNLVKTLMLEDKIREFKYANAQMNTTPIRLWTIGNDTFPADDEQIENLNSLIMNLNTDPQKNIIAPHVIKLEVIGSAAQADKMLDDLQYIENQKLTALWSNKAFTNSEGVTYNTGQTAMRVLMGRYLPIRTMIENTIYRKIFLPIAISRGYFKKGKGTDISRNKYQMRKVASKQYKDLLIPTMDWRHKQVLTDDANVRSSLIQLFQAGSLPAKVICDSLDLDYDYTMKWLEKEKGSIFDSQVTEIRKVLLNSAAAGTLNSDGLEAMTRIVDASSNWNQVILGHNENSELIKKPEEERKKNKEKETEEHKKERLESKREQKQNINTIKRKYSEHVEKQLTESRKAFKLVYNNANDLIIKSLLDQGINKEAINELKTQLYDLKILLSKQGAEYIHKKTALKQDSTTTLENELNKVLSYYQEEYETKLATVRDLRIISILQELNIDKVQLEPLLIDHEKYALIYEIDELNTNDRATLKTYWQNQESIVRDKAISNFIDLVHRTEIDTYQKLGVKQIYVNGKLTELSTFKPNIFMIDDQIVPNFNFTKKSTLQFKNFIAQNVPVELKPQVFALKQELNLKGKYDFSNETFETIKDHVYTYHLGRVYDGLQGYSIITDLEYKYSEGEVDEKEFFINQGKKYLNKQQKQSELIKFYENLIKA